MSIVSASFLLFLGLLLILYYLVPKRLQWWLLLAASLIFYCLSGIKSLVYILITALSTYAGTLLMQKLSDRQKSYLKENKLSLSKDEKSLYKAGIKKQRRLIMAAVLVLNFGILCVFKYFHFALEQLNALISAFGSDFQLHDTLNLIIPLGISFYTFQTMGYLIDVYWNKYRAEENFGRLLLFVSFFPQITQGPISDFPQLSEQLFSGHSFSYHNYSYGCQRLLWGFFKKMAVADTLAPLVGNVFLSYSSYSGISTIIGVFLYSVQIYADFSGYMDIMCGFCEILGIKLSENFERPYFSKSVAEYWRRWHITLGAWFKTYLYYPIAVSRWNQSLGRRAQGKLGKTFGKTVPASVALIFVWFTTGLWHGASWAYIAWGGVNGLFIILSLWMEPLYARAVDSLHINTSSRLWRAFQVLRTFVLISFIKVLPEVGTLSQGLGLWKRIFTDFTIPRSLSQLLPFVNDMEFFAVAMFGTLLMFAVSVLQRKGSFRDRLRRVPLPLRFLLYVGLALLILTYGVISSASGGGFMYAQF